MGVWGTAISSNDTYADVYGEFFELYNGGQDVAEITSGFLKRHNDLINSPEESNDFWFALAKAQWECKKLDDDVFKRVKEIILSGRDIEVWKVLDASPKDIKKRQEVLEKFLEKLSSEKARPKPRKKKRIVEPVFKKGDCITFKLSNGNYGGAIALEALYNTQFADNLIAITRINQPNKPIAKDFIDSEILVSKYPNGTERKEIHWISPIRFKKVSHLFEVADKIAINRNYDHSKSLWEFGSCAGYDVWVIGQADRQIEREKQGVKPTLKAFVKEYISGKSKWNFWS